MEIYLSVSHEAIKKWILTHWTWDVFIVFWFRRRCDIVILVHCASHIQHGNPSIDFVVSQCSLFNPNIEVVDRFRTSIFPFEFFFNYFGFNLFRRWFSTTHRGWWSIFNITQCIFLRTITFSQIHIFRIDCCCQFCQKMTERKNK